MKCLDYLILCDSAYFSYSSNMMIMYLAADLYFPSLILYLTWKLLTASFF